MIMQVSLLTKDQFTLTTTTYGPLTPAEQEKRQ